MSVHRHFLHNGKVKEVAEASLFPGQLGLLSGWGVFTTLRVVGGALFAWERHWARMKRDAQLLNVDMPLESDQVEQDLLRLIEMNEAPNCTMRLVVVRNGGGLWEGPASGRASDTIALTAESKRWGKSVRLGIQPHARHAASDFTSQEKKIQYLLADFENLKKRIESDVQNKVNSITDDLILKFLSIYDDFIRARDALSKQNVNVDGLDAILKNMNSLLSEYGIRPIEVLGEVFDPRLHEAISIRDDSSLDDNTITAELRKGYILKDRVIRPSLVEISKKHKEMKN